MKLRGSVLRALVLVVVASMAVPVVGCRRKGDGSADAGASDKAPFVVKDSSEGFLFTWIDEHGDFHVEQSTKDVPLVGRDAVRVTDPNRDEGTHADRVFVADMRTALPDGTYSVKVMTRAEFEALAVQRRKGKTALLESTDGGGTGPGPTPEQPSRHGALPDPNARPVVIIYGAEWCGPCHQAAAYCRSKGIPFVEKNIESDRGAAAEMQSKLAKAGMNGGSIPVLDVRGKMMVGFNPRTVDEALGSPL